MTGKCCASLSLNRRSLLLLIGGLFLFRLGFGVCSEFWFEDELQVYLIGLKFYTTGHFPYFGPDVVYTASQIPGALQGLLVGLPFYLLPVPEAPYILLNLLSTASLCLLAYYIRRRIPGIPAWFTWIWVLTCPWVMNYSTHVVNPSYVLPAAIVFVIAFMESIPALSAGYMGRRTAFVLMGFCLFWIMQLHMSWVLLLPFVLFASIHVVRKDAKQGLAAIFLFMTGCLAGGALLLPTIVTYGISAATGGTGENIVLNWKNLGEIVTVFTRYLSLASFELPRFIGAGHAERMEFIRTFWWASPFILFAGFMGFVQPLWMVIAAFRKNSLPRFGAVRMLALLTFVLIWLSFLFSVKGPSSHTFYVMFPVIMTYSMYCWKPLLEKRWIRTLAALMLLSGIVFHSVLMVDNYRRKSLYLDREKPLNAITEKDYRLLGDRRAWDRND
jgi:hypothetical protein